MNFLLPAIALAAVVTTPALAQVAPPSGAPSMPGQPAMARPGDDQRDAMQQMRERMRQIRTQTRTQMLDALSPAHRSAFASIVGQLAIAPAPDVRAAETQIDSLLSPAEKQAILAAEASARAQFGGDPQRPQPATATVPDAARALLRATSMGMGGPDMRGPGMGARS